MISQLDFCSDGTNPPSVGVDDSAADCNPSGEAEIVGCFLAEVTNEVAGTEVFAVLARC